MKVFEEQVLNSESNIEEDGAMTSFQRPLWVFDLAEVQNFFVI